MQWTHRDRRRSVSLGLAKRLRSAQSDLWQDYLSRRHMISAFSPHIVSFSWSSCSLSWSIWCCVFLNFTDKMCLLVKIEHASIKWQTDAFNVKCLTWSTFECNIHADTRDPFPATITPAGSEGCVYSSLSQPNWAKSAELCRVTLMIGSLMGSVNCSIQQGWWTSPNNQQWKLNQSTAVWVQADKQKQTQQVCWKYSNNTCARNCV